MIKVKGSFLPLCFILYLYSVNSFATELNWVGCGISKTAYINDLAKAYEAHSGVHINIEGGGATRGIRDVNDGFADIGGSCRYMLPDDPREADIGLEPVAWDALVFIAHKDNPVDSITIKQAKAIYQGKIANWKELGGDDQKIEVFIRNSKHSGVGRTLRKLLFGDYNKALASSKTFKSSGPLEEAVMENRNSFGTTGVSSARLRDVKILKLEGIEPTVENVKTSKYGLYRPLYLTYNEHSPNIKEVREFISFVHSKAGREVMRDNGVVPYREALVLVMKQIQQEQESFSKDLKL